MEFKQLMEKRTSCRHYQSKPVSDILLQQVLQAAVLAPTGANRQPFRIVLVRTKDCEAGLRKVYNRDWFVQAPVVICMCAVPDEAWVRKQSDGKNIAEIDAAIAMDHLILAAANEGLGTCWIAAFDPVAARQVLALPDRLVPVAFTPLGYPADAPGPKKRKSLNDLLIYV